jgi:hypothetical protein
MPLSTEVIVRKDDISFPQRCLVCGGNAENQHARLRGSPVGFHGVIPWIFGATKKLEVPAHQECESKLRRALMIRNLAVIVSVTAVLVLAISLGLTKWQAIGLAIAAIAIPIVWQVIMANPGGADSASLREDQGALVEGVGGEVEWGAVGLGEERAGEDGAGCPLGGDPSVVQDGQLGAVAGHGLASGKPNEIRRISKAGVMPALPVCRG